MRRPLIAAGLTAAVLSLLSGVAVAAQTVTVRSPAPGAVVSTPTAVAIDVAREFVDDRTSAVEVRLARPGIESGSWVSAPRTAALACTPGEDRPEDRGCDEQPGDVQSTWSGATLQPAGGGSFGDDPLCNGRWRVQVRLNAEEAFRTPGTAVVLSAPPAGVTDLAASVDGDRVALTWAPGREPDLVGHLVQRRTDGGDWTEAAQLSGTARSFEMVVAPGTHEFRVVSQRPDGLDAAGDPAAACEDRGPDLLAASPAVKTTVTRPRDGASPTPGGDGTDGSGEGDAGTGDESETPGGNAAAQSSSGSSGGSSASPRSRAGSAPDLVPGLAAPSFERDEPARRRERERYYGEDMEFAEELDYGGASPADDGDAEYVERALDGGTVHVVAGMELDLGRILPPVAGGLVMFTMGMHLRRWMRVD